MYLLRMRQDMSLRSSDAKTEKLLLFLKHTATTTMREKMLMLLGVVLVGLFFTLFYLVDDVTILSMDLRDGSQISQDPERLVQLKRYRELENTYLVF